MRVTLALLEGGSVAAVVILNGRIIYHEDDDKNARNSYCTAGEVAKNLVEAIPGAVLQEVLLSPDEIPADWSFDDIKDRALKKASV